MISLRERRIKSGMTQQQLSKISGVPQQTISSIESGCRNNPGIDTLFPLAKALGCTIEELLTDEETADGKVV